MAGCTITVARALGRALWVVGISSRGALILWLSLGLVLGAVGTAAANDVRLVMVEEDGCIFCAQWRADVGGEYPLTAEGRAAPLRLIDLRQPVPEDLVLKSRPRLTPTFILVRDGVELRRLEGYPGEHFFWPILTAMLTEAGVSINESEAPQPSEIR